MTHSIGGPPGYEPGALPLRHIAFVAYWMMGLWKV